MQEKLFLKVRPRTPEELCGTPQREIMRALTAAADGGRLGQTLLFLGPSGTGKTTMALMLTAHLLNMSVEEMVRGEHWQEHNCGADNGIGSIRDLINELKKTPIFRKKFRVVILNEIQALTKAAQQGLLDELENLPEDVIILGTAMQDSFLDAFRSRFSTYVLPSPSRKEFFLWLKSLSRKQEIKLTKEQAYDIYSMSEGNLREAVNLLEKVANNTFSAGSQQTLEEESSSFPASIIWQHVFFRSHNYPLAELVACADAYPNGLEALRFALLNYARKRFISGELPDKRYQALLENLSGEHMHWTEFHKGFLAVCRGELTIEFR